MQDERIGNSMITCCQCTVLSSHQGAGHQTEMIGKDMDSLIEAGWWKMGDWIWKLVDGEASEFSSISRKVTRHQTVSQKMKVLASILLQYISQNDGEQHKDMKQFDEAGYMCKTSAVTWKWCNLEVSRWEPVKDMFHVKLTCEKRDGPSVVIKCACCQICTHRNPWGTLKRSFAITRLTVHSTWLL